MINDKFTVDRAIEITTWAVAALAGLVILAAGILSYSALRDLFLMMGLFPDWLAWLFPLLFDLTEVSFALAVWNAHLQGKDDQWAWKMVVIFTICGVAANVTHAVAAWWFGQILREQAALAVFLTSLFPISVALATHLLKQTITLAVERAERPVREKDTELEKVSARLNKMQKTIDDLLARPVSAASRNTEKELRKLQVVAYIKDNPDTTKTEAYEAIGVAKSTGQTYFKELQADGRLTKNGNGWEVIE